MKYAITLIAALAASQLYADDTPTKEGWCSKIAVMAESMMDARQSGVSLQTVLDVVEEHMPSARDLAILAWDEPRYNTPEFQERVIGDFRDRAHLECLRG